jgi:hypothetical protein
MKMKHNLPESMGHGKGCAWEKGYSHLCYFKNTKVSQMNDLMLHLKPLGKQEQAKPKLAERDKY